MYDGRDRGVAGPDAQVGVARVFVHANLGYVATNSGLWVSNGTGGATLLAVLGDTSNWELHRRPARPDGRQGVRDRRFAGPHRRGALGD